MNPAPPPPPGGLFSRLWVRLLLAFAALLLFAVLIPTAYVRRQSQIEFQQYASGNQSQLKAQIAGNLALAYLGAGGDWRGDPPDGDTTAEFLGQRLIITDNDGIVRADSAGERVGQRFTGEDGWERTAIDDSGPRAASSGAAGASPSPAGRAGALLRPTGSATYGVL